jgi:sulfur-oxidizing protein SoxY
MMGFERSAEDGAMPLPLKCLGSAALAGMILFAPAAKADEDVWPTLKQQAFGDRPIAAEDGTVVLEIPGTAEDAALVPLTVRVPPQVKQNLKSLTLFIDKNPDPRVATLTFGPAPTTSSTTPSTKPKIGKP